MALLGRNKAVGVGLAALLFAALIDRDLDAEPRSRDLPARARLEPDRHDPGPRRALRRRRRPDPLPAERAQARPAAGRDEAAGVSARVTATRLPARRPRASPGVGDPRSASRRSGWRSPPLKVARADRAGHPSACVALGARRSGRASAGVKRHRLGGGRRSACSASPLGYLATRSSVAHLDQVVVWSALIAAMLRYATPLAFAAMGGIFSERSGVVNIGLEGMMLSGAFFGILGADKLDSWPLGLLCAALAGGALRARPRVLRDPPARRPDRRRDGDQLPGARDHRLSLHRHLRRRGHAAGHPGDPGRPPGLPRGLVLHRAGPRAAQPDDLARVPDDRRDLGRALQDADRAADPRRRRAPARRRHGRDLGLRDALRGGDALRRSSPRSAARTSRSASSTRSTRT